LRSGVDFASDVLAGKNAKQAAIERAKSTSTKLLNQAVGPKKWKRPQGRVQKKRRKKNPNIFD